MIFELVSKNPHKTSWVRVLYTEAEAAEFAKLLEDVKTIGWNPECPHGFRRAPPCFYIEIPGVEGKHSEGDISSPRGTDLFGGWNDAERRKNLRDIKAFLKTRTPWRITSRKLTLEDLL